VSNIKVGDLVMVVKPSSCCGNTLTIGDTFTVTSIDSYPSICGHCLKETKEYVVGGNSRGSLAAVNRLIKIDPPALPESLECEKELSV
jgi:hypothetical protein